MKSFFLVLLVLQFFGSFAEGNKKHVQSISLPILKDISGSINVNTIFDEFEYIPLESSEQSIFAHIDKLVIHNNHFYILDKAKAKKIFVFAEDGKFIRTIGRIGKGPGEYSNIEDFTIATETDNVVILTYPSRVITYDSKGQFINEKRLSSSVLLWNISSTKRGYICSTNHQSGQKGIEAFLIYKFDKVFNLQEKLIEALPQQVGMPPLISNPFIKCKDEVTYFDFFKSSVHFNVSNSDFRTIHFDFEGNETPINSYINPQLFFDKQKEYSFFLDAIFADNILYSTFINKGKQHVLIMDLANNKNTTYRVDKWFPNFLFSQNNLIYSSIEPSMILKGHNFFKAKDTSKFPIDYLSNPVILRFKTKHR